MRWERSLAPQCTDSTTGIRADVYTSRGRIGAVF